MMFARARCGYVFLLSVLFVGVIAVAITATMLMLGWLAIANSQIMQQSSKALTLAETCAEHALLQLYEDNTYDGLESVTNSDGICAILRVGGAGNENRTVCIEGTSGASTRRLEIVLQRLLPSVLVYSWQEVKVFTSCTYD
ncbi:TPA: hypothetical protein DCL30_00250 [Candidatus Peribacteria bacterium]|nr:MAG: hypothetical protein A3J91_05340 [Candidatus Peribacteria bacterium RIFOXYC2_FULL_58_10]OGJ84396.1 MAG: hypothetical protein A2529_03325 [Candidatus Peribacteria bacterium RIFOXYD2_FULL_58_15]HAI97960.1 hypothetical protein [Candidatus Peribacteria bacterium]HAS34674.1 hypothetical protein [Candidatus Peribacteria bacterium]